jgi:cytochrome oxidase Cu insertion factor (SCO1/SenC/PrrC family)
MRFAGLLIALVLQATPAVNFDTIGPKVGEAAPDFELRDQHGERRTLAALAGRNGTMLVFYRSADW